MPRTKIGFVLLSHSDNPIPSTRISVLNMFPYLDAADYEPVISFQPDASSEDPDVSGLAEKMADQGIAIAYFQKVHGQGVLDELRKLSGYGIKTVYGVCDLIENEMAEAADATIVVTDYLKSLYDPKLQHKIHVVHDGIEHPDFQKFSRDAEKTNRPLRAILVTSSELHEIPTIGTPPRFVEVTIVGRYPPASSFMQEARNTYWKFRSKRGFPEKIAFAGKLLHRGFKTANWNIDSVYPMMAAADIGIIPVDMRIDPLPKQNVSYWQVKSENRLTMKMSVGLPVIASPVPSYQDVIHQGKSGFLASSREDWLACFEALRDPGTRREMGHNARESVTFRFSKEEQARKLIQVFDLLAGRPDVGGSTSS